MKNRLVCDLHMHTLMSGHAYGTIREMAKAASKAGLQAIGITEHGPGIPGTCHPIYFSNLACVPHIIDGVEIFNGAEMNLDNDGNIYDEGMYYNALDYLIAGIHCTNGIYQNQGTEKNTDNLIKCMNYPKVKIISHPDCDFTPLNYERLVKAAVEHRVALELNNSSLTKPQLRLNCFENYRKMLPLCMKYGCNIVINSDAHDPSAIGNYELAIRMIDELNFDEELILNTSVEKFRKFIKDEI